MEKMRNKLCKIDLQFQEITAEKQDVQDTLNQVMDQVSSIFQHVKKNHSDMKPKDVSGVQRYILEVLKQFTEINALLENLLEENPLHIPAATPSGISFPTSQSSILPDLPELPDTPQGQFKSFQEFSENLGLSNKNISEMKDYYKKSSQNYTHCSTVLPESLTDSSNSEVADTKQIEIPEKDTNTSQEYSKPGCSLVVPHDTSSSSSISTSPMIYLSEDSSIESDTNIAKKHKEESVLNSAIWVDNNNKYTALEKLNNYIPHVEHNDNSQNSIALDIKLKPSGDVIQNFIPPNKSKKKRDKRKNEENEFYDLKPKEVPIIGDECIICHVESPAEFYIHVVDGTTEIIDDFEIQLNDYFKKYDKIPKYESKEDALMEIGRFCIAFCGKYRSWYRAEILDGYRHDKHDEVLVHLVDYGNRTLVSYKNLRKLSENMTQLPMLAIRCHFPLLYPPESTRLNRLTTWPVSSKEGLMNISGNYTCRDNEAQYFRIVYASQEGNSVAIDLYNIEMGSEENTVGQILMDTGLAVQLVDDYDENDLDLEEFLEDIHTLEVDNINEAVMGYDPRDEARACRFTKPDGTCFKGKHCKLDHIPLSKDGTTTDKEPVFTECMYSLVLPQVGSTIKILVTGYIDTCRFLAQLIETPYNTGKYLMDQEVYNLLVEMNSDKVVKTYEPFKVAPALSEVVILKHWKKWSRAIVREIFMGDESNEAQVLAYVVDFGEYVRVPVKEVRKIKPHFLKLPFQAVECYIHKYQSNPKCPEKDAKNFFYEHLYFRNFTAITMCSYPPFRVELRSMNGLIEVGETLAAKGYAARRRRDMYAMDECPFDLD